MINIHCTGASQPETEVKCLQLKVSVEVELNKIFPATKTGSLLAHMQSLEQPPCHREADRGQRWRRPPHKFALTHLPHWLHFQTRAAFWE